MIESLCNGRGFFKPYTTLLNLSQRHFEEIRLSHDISRLLIGDLDVLEKVGLGTVAGDPHDLPGVNASQVCIGSKAPPPCMSSN